MCLGQALLASSLRPITVEPSAIAFFPTKMLVQAENSKLL